MQFLDQSFLLTQFGDKATAQTVLQVYLEEESGLSQPLMVALAEKPELAEVDESAHKIKGSLDLIGVKSLARLSAEICEACRADKEPEAWEKLSELCRSLPILRSEVETYLKP